MKNKMELTEVLADCLEGLERKEMSYQDCLDKYPQHREELTTLLRKFATLRSLPLETVRADFRKKGHQALLNAITDRQPETFADRLERILQGWAVRRQRKFSPVGVIAAAILAFFVATGGVAYASNDAGPGDLLYGLDLALEQVQLQLTGDPETAAALHLAFVEERMMEFEDRVAADDLENAQAALDGYGVEIAALAALVAGPDGFDDQAQIELVNAALEVHRDVLSGVLEKVPDQAREAIQNAIDKNDNFQGNLKDKDKPAKPGKPDKPDKPDKPVEPESHVPGNIPLFSARP